MLERLKGFLATLAGADETGPDADDPRLAAVALLVHVANADGGREASESARLNALVAQAYQLSDADAERLIARGAFADEESVDFYRFTRILARALDRDAKRAFVSMMWQVAYSDRALAEVEDHVIARIAELIGIEKAERIALRQAAALGEGR